jgi:hypothetical protein
MYPVVAPAVFHLQQMPEGTLEATSVGKRQGICDGVVNAQQALLGNCNMAMVVNSLLMEPVEAVSGCREPKKFLSATPGNLYRYCVAAMSTAPENPPPPECRYIGVNTASISPSRVGPPQHRLQQQT